MPEVLVKFDRAIQNDGPLREAAYRLIGLASCIVEIDGDRYVCRLQLNGSEGAHRIGDQELRQRFIDLVTDENLRAKISEETTGIRNVILALAFGALIEQTSDDSSN